MQPIDIRIAAASDATSIAELSEQLGYPVSVRQSGDRLKRILASDKHIVLVAAAGDRIVAWIHLFIARRLTSDPFAEIGGLVVAQRFRGRGIGNRLLADAGRWALGQGAATLRVRSRTSRDDARAFYENEGFAIAKDQHVFVKALT